MYCKFEIKGWRCILKIKCPVKNKRGGGISNFSDFFLRPLPSLLIFQKSMNVLSRLTFPIKIGIQT